MNYIVKIIDIKTDRQINVFSIIEFSSKDSYHYWSFF